jgi:cytochrome b6-f complex iron-sulfur subunit
LASSATAAIGRPIPRRRFIRYALFGLLGAVTATGTFTSLKLLYPTKVEGFGTKVAAGTVEEIRALLASQRYVRNTTGKFYLLPAAEDSTIAVYWRCVHLGCTVPAPNPDINGNIQCPCHGSLYNGETGDLIHGPATRPLDYFPISVENGMVIVDTGKVTVRQEFEPSQAVALR